MENKPVNKALTFKADDVKITLGDTEYRLVYDLNAFCELEKTYGSIDNILKLILGGATADVDKTVAVDGKEVPVEQVTIGGKPLSEMLDAMLNTPKATHQDTLNLLYAGTMHDAAIYNEHDEITGYKTSKSKLGAQVTLRNVREVNAAVVAAILRDLVPAQNNEAGKNTEAPDAAE